ncbi:MAG: hypothetical protein AMXMBFR78_34230 [Rubrivivax sp.]
MNCKKGDVAQVIRADSDPEHLGAVVVCEWFQCFEHRGGPGWETSPVLRTKDGRGIVWHDGDLRPLRDSDGEDEVLRLAGRPVGTHQAA